MNMYDDYGHDEMELEDACKTLIKAEEIKSNEKLMEKLKPLLEKKKAAINKVSGVDAIKEKAKSRIEEIDKEESKEEAKEKKSGE